MLNYVRISSLIVSFSLTVKLFSPPFLSLFVFYAFRVIGILFPVKGFPESRPGVSGAFRTAKVLCAITAFCIGPRSLISSIQCN